MPAVLLQALPYVENDVSRLTFINNVNACMLFLPFVSYFEGSIILTVLLQEGIVYARGCQNTKNAWLELLGLDYG